ncbi:unnamed protein product [Mytilus coruscus]|uniref:Uncharacterized protein n=1 Tax=Mytilus coruscus TaxID=42192 RepID=A0A6J8CTL1_MYTCO|nr:unnamed protein product [Mytilus coruscus]
MAFNDSNLPNDFHVYLDTLPNGLHLTVYNEELCTEQQLTLVYRPGANYDNTRVTDYFSLLPVYFWSCLEHIKCVQIPTMMIQQTPDEYKVSLHYHQDNISHDDYHQQDDISYNVYHQTPDEYKVSLHYHQDDISHDDYHQQDDISYNVYHQTHAISYDHQHISNCHYDDHQVDIDYKDAIHYEQLDAYHLQYDIHYHHHQDYYISYHVDDTEYYPRGY